MKQVTNYTSKAKHKDSWQYPLINSLNNLLSKLFANFSWAVNHFSDKVENVNIQETKVMVAKGDDANINHTEGNTDLMIAAQKGDAEMIKKLLAQGVNVNEQNKNGQTALHYAVKSRHKDIVELLIENHANIDAKNHRGMTASIIAIQIGDTELRSTLLAGARSQNKPQIRKQKYRMRDELVNKAGVITY